MNAIAQPVAAPSTRDARDARNDKLFRWVLVGTVIFVLIALACAALSMLWGGRHALQMQGLSFFFSADWNPVENKFGALAPIYGTLVTAVIAMVIAVPVSFGIAFFLTELSPAEVWVTHGREEALVRWCALNGLAARPLHLVGYEDEPD